MPGRLAPKLPPPLAGNWPGPGRPVGLKPLPPKPPGLALGRSREGRAWGLLTRLLQPPVGRLEPRSNPPPAGWKPVWARPALAPPRLKSAPPEKPPPEKPPPPRLPPPPEKPPPPPRAPPPPRPPSPRAWAGWSAPAPSPIGKPARAARTTPVHARVVVMAGPRCSRRRSSWHRCGHRRRSGPAPDPGLRWRCCWPGARC